MGTNLLIISLGSLILIWSIDFFTTWYAKFLRRWMPDSRIRVLLGQLFWAILSVTFWFSLVNDDLSKLLSTTYFFFVLFIYSVRGLVHSLVRRNDKNSIFR